MTSRPLVILGVIIIAIAIIAATGYLINGQNASMPASTVADQSASGSSTGPTAVSPVFYQSTSTPDEPVPTVNPPTASVPPAGQASPVEQAPDDSSASSTPDIPFPASTTVATASWIVYADNASGYSFEHPADLLQNTLNGGITFSFPKNTYFHWPLLDDATITVTVGASCPKITIGAGSPNFEGPVSFALNGYQFARTVGTDVAAGQRYLEVAYDTETSGQCYHIDLLDQGADGASFYVDDDSLIAKYDAQHSADLAAVISIFNGVVGSFRLLVPAH